MAGLSPGCGVHTSVDSVPQLNLVLKKIIVEKGKFCFIDVFQPITQKGQDN